MSLLRILAYSLNEKYNVVHCISSLPSGVLRHFLNKDMTDYSWSSHHYKIEQETDQLSGRSSTPDLDFLVQATLDTYLTINPRTWRSTVLYPIRESPRGQVSRAACNIWLYVSARGAFLEILLCIICLS